MSLVFALALGYYIWDLATEPASFTVVNTAGGKVTFGDINADGIEDLVFRNNAADGPNGERENCGEVYVIFGRSGLSGTWDMSVKPPDYLIYGADTNQALGRTLATGDVNGDGFDDILVSDNRRHAYLIYGSDSLRGVRDLAVDSADYTIDAEGYTDYNYFAWFMEMVDVNNDGLLDLVFSDENTSIAQGKIDIIFNNGELRGKRVFASEPPDAIIWGPGPGSNFAHLVTHAIWKGDADSDGDDELCFATRYNGSAWAERGYLLYSVNPGNNYLEGCADYKVYPDVLAEKPDQLNPGAPSDLLLHRFHMEGIYGTVSSPFFGTRNMESEPPDFYIYGLGGQTNAQEVSDLNRDGWIEIISGNPNAPDGGKVQVFSLVRHPYGEWDPEVDTADVVILADPDVNEFFGKLIAVGDVNGDGYPELAVSDSYADHDGKEWTGAVYLFDLHDLINTADTGQREFPAFSLCPTVTEGRLFLYFSLNADCSVSWRVFDLSGRVVKEGDLGALDRGKHQESLFLGELPQGVYVFQLRRGELRTRRVFAVVK